ncbi:hypothetical protein ACSBR2_019028 [Camellia fascicularis]
MRNLRPCSSDSGKSNNVRTVISCFVVGVAVLFVSLACFIYVKYKYKPENHDRPIKQYSSLDMKQFHKSSFTEEEVINAIKKENLIGKDSGGRRSCMIPKANLRLLEYDAEVATLSLIRHVNVLKLYCCITSEDWNLLVYKYLSKTVGAAKGLKYLHNGCDRPVIHRNVKTSNILLNEQLKPKIADFGLAKVVQPNGVWDFPHIIAGTHGYIAPGKMAKTVRAKELENNSKFNDRDSVGRVALNLGTNKSLSGYSIVDNSSEDQC